MVIDETGDKPFVVIDNLDNLKPIKQTNNPVRDIDNTMEYLRSITVSTGATMLVLSQLNKEAMRENRTDLVAFRGSGSINHYSAVALGMRREGEVSINGEDMPLYVFEIQKKRWGSTTDSVSAVLDYKNLRFLEYETPTVEKEEYDA
jgi:replicative DNA helicase